MPNIKKTDIEACNGPVMRARCEANSAEAEKRAKFLPGEKKASTVFRAKQSSRNETCDNV